MTRVNKLAGVVDLGSSGVRLLLAESIKGRWKSLETLEKTCGLGHDVFLDGEISEETYQDVIKVLVLYLEHLKSWGLAANDLHCVATSAVREASNRDMFVERVQLRTGLKFRILEGMEANYLTYRAVDYALKGKWPLKQSSSIIVEASGGATEVMLLNRGVMVGAHSLPLGTVRLDHQLRGGVESKNFIRNFLVQHVEQASQQFETEFPLKNVRHFLALGSDLRRIGRAMGEKQGAYYRVKREDFLGLVKQVKNQGSAAVASEYGVSHADAGAFFATLNIYGAFLSRCSAKTIIVPDVSLRDGVLLEASSRSRKTIKEQLSKEIVASAWSLARKYGVHKEHAEHVLLNAMEMYDALEKVYGLKKEYRVYLQLAAILHDIGRFVSHHNHGKHGMYLVQNSELFALQKIDLNIIGQVIRYHRKVKPSHSHPGFAALSRDERITVLKLSAILRVAEGLDCRHLQRYKIHNVDVNQVSGILDLEIVSDRHMSTMEREVLKLKADLILDVYGLQVKVSEGVE
jgi:exopolyphosphatase / guanosine-5'-triphosphate,3'-diphosphate pyrophosphatase